MIRRFSAIFGAILAFAPIAKADFKDMIAQRFSVDSKYLILNLPPRPDVWPGAIFTSSLRVPIKHGDPKDAALHRGIPISLEAKGGFDLGATAKAGALNWLGFSAEAGDVADIAMSFPDARVIDMDYDDLLHHIEKVQAAIDAAKRGKIPLVVIKAYAGTPIITITRKSNVSAEAWAKLKNQANVGASASSANSVTYKAAEAFVFAFETQQITFETTNSEQHKGAIILTALPQEIFIAREDQHEKDIADLHDILTSHEFAVVFGSEEFSMAKGKTVAKGALKERLKPLGLDDLLGR